MKVEKLRGWSTDYAQISIFVSSLIKGSVGELFKSVFDKTYEQVNEQHFAPIGYLGLAAASFDGFLLQFSVQPNRYDLIIRSPDTSRDGQPAGLPQSFVEALEVIEKAAIILSERIVGATRVAVHGRFVSQFEHLEDANDKIGLILPVEVDLKGISDFAYQENRPTSVDGLPINRLARYSVEQVVMMLGQQSPDGRFVPSSNNQVSHHAAIVLLDFNTLASGPTLDGENIRGALRLLKLEILRVAGFGE